MTRFRRIIAKDQRVKHLALAALVVLMGMCLPTPPAHALLGVLRWSGSPPFGATPGSPTPWVGSFKGGLNTGSGNKLTSIQIVPWINKGGMPIDCTLYHNSQGTRNAELGQKWSLSFNARGAVDGSGNFTVIWGDETSYVFTKSGSSTYTAAAGHFDTMVATGSPPTTYDLTTKGQVTYHFTNPNSTGWFLATQTDAHGNTVTINRNTSDQVTSVTDSNGKSVSFTYTSGKITSIGDPLGRSWPISYTGSDLTQVTWPTVSSHTYNQQFAYNSVHDITTYTDFMGNAWTYAYDATYNTLTSQTDPCNNVTSFSYGSSSTTITDPNSNVTTHSYSSGQLSGVTDALSNSASYSYDSNHNRTGKTDKRGKSWSWTYDSSGNVLTATDPLSHTITNTYNSKNRLLSVVDALGNKTVYTYDATLSFDCTKIEVKDSSNTVLSTTNRTYNAAGTMATQVDSNNHTTSYGYDSNGYLTSMSTHNGHVTYWVRNALGYPTSRTDALGNVVTYTLDNWNQVTRTNYPGSVHTDVTYNAAGQISNTTWVLGTIGYTYDACGRPTAQVVGGNTYSSWTYDATGKHGQLSTETDKNNRTVTFSYTPIGKRYQVIETAGTTTYGYDANGNETSTTTHTGSTVTKLYDDANRLTSVTNTNGGTTLSSFTYTFNNDDRRSSCTEANGDVQSWTYDAAGHLTGDSRAGGSPYTKTYAYDGAGNRTSSVVGGVTTNYTYSNDNELTATSGGLTSSYTYNANGWQTNRTVSGVSSNLTYDYDGQLLSITQGSNVTSFQYDVMGRRFSRTDIGGNYFRFLWGQNGILQDTKGGVANATYTIGNSMIRRNSEYTLNDGIRNERTITNSSQTITGTAIYDAFGLLVAWTGSSSNPYMYNAESGYETQGDANLQYVAARYYDPQVGAFITRDTTLSELPYAYCDGDPVNYTDPTGHQKKGPFKWWDSDTWGDRDPDDPPDPWNPDPEPPKTIKPGPNPFKEVVDVIVKAIIIIWKDGQAGTKRPRVRNPDYESNHWR